ncbi:MAG TPA: chemotaxis response regulator protein-glutamate methylesterase [Candidatus Wallbacteria bacterium]|nr:chemotaxis response regulator protein-glutamate methylesterase [Candidatus Wallbacteria bacterium]
MEGAAITSKIKVLIVDDSALVREILARGLAMDPGIEVVGTAADPYAARDKIVFLKPDVLTLDIEMPKMDGVEFLKKLMPQYPLPVVVVSALTKKGAAITLEALEAGAVEIVTKPSTDISRNLNAMLADLREKVKLAAATNVSAWKKNKKIETGELKINKKALAESTDKVIAIGASTGGTEAIRKILKAFPATMPGVVIVQHMPAGFTSHFAASLNDTCQMEVREAENGDRIMPGRVLIARGDIHLEVHRSGGVYIVRLEDGEKVCGHRPSVEVLFNSIAKFVGSNAIGVMLTGMGSDGAAGMLEMRKAGARTMAQDEATSIVFGMPKVAFEKGGAERLVALGDIPAAIIDLLEVSA